MAWQFGQSPSYWVTNSETNYPALETDLSVDVAVVGAGIVGVTAAFLLKRAGLSVALIEGRRVARQITGGTMAQISSGSSLMYTDLAWRLGEAPAKLYGQAHEAALKLIADLVEERGIDCDFERLPAYSYTGAKWKVPALRKEAEVAARLGLPASFVKDAPASVPIVGAVKFENQAQFHPVKYLLDLVAAIPGRGCYVFENTRVLGLQAGAPCQVETDKGKLHAKDVILSTGLPIIDTGRYLSRARPYAHPSLAANVPKETAPQGMFASIDRSNMTFRTHAGADGATMLVVMGPRFTPGPGNSRYYDRRTEDWTRRYFEITQVANRWINEDYFSVDRMPFVGAIGRPGARVWIATGFTSWGMTGGTSAAMILTDLIKGVENPMSAIFDPLRKLLFVPKLVFAWQNMGMGARWVAGRVKAQWRKNADAFGDHPAAQPICTHMGCSLVWNDIAKTWDCPYDGSRFDVEGRVLYGPAIADLDMKSLSSGSAPD